MNLGNYNGAEERINAIQEEMNKLQSMLEGEKACVELEDVHGFDYRGYDEYDNKDTFTNAVEYHIKEELEYEGAAPDNADELRKLAKIADQYIKDNDLYWR